MDELLSKITTFSMEYRNEDELKQKKELFKELFDTTAQGIALKLTDIKITQFRKFYDKILELNEKAQGMGEDEFQLKVLPFVKMLNSKVQFSKSRGHSGENFVKLMTTSIVKVNSIDELQNFKYFLESIIGFMPRNNN